MSSSAAFWIAFDFFVSSVPSSSFVIAAAFLMMASDFLKAAGALVLLIWKFSSARVVKEPKYASSGTFTSPIESFSMRNFCPERLAFSIYFVYSLPCFYVKSLCHYRQASRSWSQCEPLKSQNEAPFRTKSGEETHLG